MALCPVVAALAGNKSDTARKHAAIRPARPFVNGKVLLQRSCMFPSLKVDLGVRSYSAPARPIPVAPARSHEDPAECGRDRKHLRSRASDARNLTGKGKRSPARKISSLP